MLSVSSETQDVVGNTLNQKISSIKEKKEYHVEKSMFMYIFYFYFYVLLETEGILFKIKKNKTPLNSSRLFLAAAQNKYLSLHISETMFLDKYLSATKTILFHKNVSL